MAQTNASTDYKAPFFHIFSGHEHLQTAGRLLFFPCQSPSEIQPRRSVSLKGGINDRHAVVPRDHAEVYLGAWKFLEAARPWWENHGGEGEDSH